MIFLNFDLSQAENRVTLMLTRDAKMIEMARTAPWELDMHSLNAEIIWGERWKEIPDARHLGKKVSHGAQRGMSARRLSDTILKDLGLFVEELECEKHLTTYMRYYAPLKDYFKDIRLQVVKYRMLCNTWGRILRFTHDNLDDAGVFREAFSFLPQSEVADLLNQWGFKPLYYWLKREKPWCRINLQVHDSVLLSCRPSDVWEIRAFVQSRLERPRVYYGNRLTIPVDFSLGSTWATEFEFKKPPTREEFEAAAWECEARRQGITLEECQ